MTLSMVSSSSTMSSTYVAGSELAALRASASSRVLAIL